MEKKFAKVIQPIFYAHIFIKNDSIKDRNSRIWKWRLKNGGYVVSALMYQCKFAHIPQVIYSD